jgi:hypothetical protein
MIRSLNLNVNPGSGQLPVVRGTRGPEKLGRDNVNVYKNDDKHLLYITIKSLDGWRKGGYVKG